MCHLCLCYTCYVCEALLVLVVCVCSCYQVLYTVHVPLWYLLKLCLEGRTVRMWVYYTSGIVSYKALHKGSFKKPWYYLNVQSHISYFANMLCQICLYCRLHPLHHTLHSCPCPPNSLSSFLLLCFILAPLPPSHFWWVFNCSFVIADDLVQLLFHHDEEGDCFFALLLNHYCIVRVPPAWYCSFGTRGLQYRLYDDWCTITVLSACTTPVHAAWYGSSFCTNGLQYSSAVLTISVVLRQPLY
jgi:hypothetical protein